MINIPVPGYKYCPFCGKPLQHKEEEGCKRSFCATDNWTYYPHVATSCAAVIVHDGKVLMVQRKRHPYKGTWMFPSGFSEYGEHPDETVKREVREETGLTTTNIRLVKIMQSVDDKREPGHNLIIYKIDVANANGKLETDEEENQNIAWFDLSNPPEIGWVTHQQIIKEIQDGTF